jgi:hypothetical protein
MATPTPDQVFSGFDVLETSDPAPSQGIFIPLADLPSLTAAEAANDFRAVLYALTEHTFTNYTALTDAQKSLRMSLTRGNPSYQGVANSIRMTYTLSFDLSYSLPEMDLAAEPA